MTIGEAVQSGDDVSQTGQNGETEENRAGSTPLDTNIAMRCVLKDTLQRFVQCFEDEEDPFKESVSEMMSKRDESGKTPLDMAAILGRTDMMRELINRGSQVNKSTTSGYSAIHFTAAWGQISCLKVLVDNGADIHSKTSHGEKPRDIAVRYNQAECVDYLDWAEAKQNLLDSIASIREMMADPEKNQGKLDRTDKTTVTGLCTEKSDWIENTADATTQDFISQREALDASMEPIWAKINETVPEKEVKK